MPVNVGGDDGEVEGQIQGILLAEIGRAHV